MKKPLSMGLDWTNGDADPLSPTKKREVLDYLLSIRVREDIRVNGFNSLLQKQCAGRRVLDIGMAEHAMTYVDQPQWKHRLIREVATYILGIDVVPSVIEELRKNGYNVRCVDALGDDDLEERFDVVLCGDVIEHVNDPVRLLRFSKRHLAPAGRIIVSTPNPFYWGMIRNVFRDGTFIANLEHVSWITPTMALEIGRRAGVALSRYSVMDGCRSPMKRLIRPFFPPEFLTLQYVYEFIPIESVVEA